MVILVLNFCLFMGRKTQNNVTDTSLIQKKSRRSFAELIGISERVLIDDYMEQQDFNSTTETNLISDLTGPSLLLDFTVNSRANYLRQIYDQCSATEKQSSLRSSTGFELALG